MDVYNQLPAHTNFVRYYIAECHIFHPSMTGINDLFRVYRVSYTRLQTAVVPDRNMMRHYKECLDMPAYSQPRCVAFIMYL